MKTIQNIIRESIATKERILRDTELLFCIDKAAEFTFAATEAVLPTLNTCLPNFRAGFTLTESRLLPRLCTSILPI